MHTSRFVRAVCFTLVSLLSGCYASIGPTIGVDLPTGRATIGLEASGATVTLAQSVALGATHAPPSVPAHSVDPRAAQRAEAANEAKYWTSRTYLLWEPGIPIPYGNTDDSFGWGSFGATVGVRLDHYAQREMRAGLAAGGWIGIAHTLKAREPRSECRASDVRPYVGVVAGIRGSELYVSPKFGVLDVPRLCLGNLFGSDDGSSGFD